jgi:hypothetical protein
MHSLWFLLLSLVFMATPPQEKATSEITFCNFELPRNVKIANASFNVIYSFEINEEGQPVKIIKIHDDYIGEDIVTSCLENWRLHGITKGARFVVNFRWQHAEGWVELTVAGTEFVQKIKLARERCPYQRMQSAKSN